MDIDDSQRRTLLSVDPVLSRFNPLPRILTHDDFDTGVNGWAELCGNHDGNLRNIRELTRDLRPPQLSSCTFFDIGTHGSMSGTYALKLATRPITHHTASLLKRLTAAGLSRVQFEMYFTFKPEAQRLKSDQRDPEWDGNFSPSEGDFGDFTIAADIGGLDDGVRYHCAIRYENTLPDGRFSRQWKAKTTVHPTTKMMLDGSSPALPTDLHTQSPEDWRLIPGGKFAFCYNEVPTKVNWHYLRWQFDMKTRRNVDLQINDVTLQLVDIDVPVYTHPYESLRSLMNIWLDVRTHKMVRNFLYLDSALISVDW